MFKTPYATVQARNAAQSDWGVEMNMKLFKLGMTKRQLAQGMNANYSQVCNVISGTVYNANLRQRITDAATELERGTT